MTTQTEALKLEPHLTHLYQNLDGKWSYFIDARHYENTVVEGSWRIINLSELLQVTHHQEPSIHAARSHVDSDLTTTLAQPEQDTCKGCNGIGVVGNILDTDTCPFCKGSGIEAQPEQEPNYKALYEKAVEQYNTLAKALENPSCGVAQTKEPEQSTTCGEPVAWQSILGAIARGWCYEENANKTIDKDLAEAIAKEVYALYTTPPQRKPLTWEEIHKVVRDANHIAWSKFGRMAKDEEIARAIEAAHGIKE